MREEIKKLREMIESSENLVFFGGAGVSTESGIPDFRSSDGLYSKDYDGYPPEYLLSTECFDENPTDFWKFYRDKILVDGVEPNDAHKVLAKLEQEGKLKAIVTQNIDDLHERAGSKNVYHIHGSILTNRCPFCNRIYTVEEIKRMPMVPRCKCLSAEREGFVIKPDVTLYGELLPQEAWRNSVKALQHADTCIVAGTSLQVNPAASLIQCFYGKNLIIINRDPTQKDQFADLVIHDSVGKVLREAME